ncbi:hypothetical protein JR316_0005798 [Psilocybe cubensis]|uniref:Uncharacterized protein n=2 Tax=Psilocybe cubensis TaxID=181762 RepID=A0A8H7Y211_PSICU|nr:hypothetical protein JR316_0005798 [Psilocybe cubensis]KAH9481276.1 hypothetical protein JR316_0005798 [Psilocybe cubensis]
MSAGLICAYPLSGGYGPIPRFLYYILLIITLVFHKTKWLVDSTLGASMIFSSIAAVHALALDAAKGKATVDLDIIPVYAITGVGLVAAIPLMVWSKTLREAETSARLLVFLWILVMFTGNMASLASIKKIPSPVPCDADACTALVCNVTLPLRQSQQIVSVPFHLGSFIIHTWSTLFSWTAGWLAFMAIIFFSEQKRPLDLARAQLKTNVGSRRFRRKNADRVATCAVCAPPLAVGFCVGHIVVMEVAMLGPRGLPVGENMTAIGQWGPLVGAAFATIASIIQWGFYEPEVKMASTRDVEQMRRVSQTDRAPGAGNGVFDTAMYFQEGYWWGRGADALPVMEHGGVKWIVREGKLTRFEQLPEMSTVVVRDETRRCKYPLF